MIFDHQLKTDRRQDLIDITALVEKDLEEASIGEGLCVIFVTHTTAALTINENADPDVPRDMFVKLTQLVPENDNYRHLEGNSDAHILSTLIGCSLTIPVEHGKLLLGTWQGIFFVELDGPRQRRFKVKLQAD
ncbi:MAG: secondary thiamine-phosphate synthase enzyme YjbQ [Deltaproteobacteria bacterium]|nr:secondary thiamine-phosphate synthase enzyme YjbQ [Deltaproteobacteria bacterium]